MDHEQSWPEHVYRRNRHHIRAIIRQRNQGSGLRTVSGRHSLHIASANTHSVIIGHKIFKFRPAINLGCCAGSRTTTAALGAIQESLDSTLPAMGYTVTYAVGNTMLILMGVAIVLMTS